MPPGPGGGGWGGGNKGGGVVLVERGGYWGSLSMNTLAEQRLSLVGIGGKGWLCLNDGRSNTKWTVY